MPTDNIYTVEQVARRLDVSSRTIRRYLEQGKFPGVRQHANGWYIFREQDIADFKKAYPRNREKRVYLKQGAKPIEKRAYNRRKVKGKG